MPPDPPRGSRSRRSYLKAPLNKYSCQYEHPSKNLSYAPDYLYRHSVPRLQQHDPFHHGLYVGLYVPGYILLHSLSLNCFHCTCKLTLWDLRKNNFLLSRSGYFPSHDGMQISITMFLIDGTNLLPVTPLSTKKKTNKQQQQTIKTNK